MKDAALLQMRQKCVTSSTQSMHVMCPRCYVSNDCKPWTCAQVFAGLLVGAMLPYWFSAMTMKSVGKAALAMVEEARSFPLFRDQIQGFNPDSQFPMSLLWGQRERSKSYDSSSMSIYRWLEKSSLANMLEYGAEGESQVR